MRTEPNGTLIRHVPLTLVVTLLLQAATVVWWASARDRDNLFLGQRVTNLESNLTRTMEGQSQTLERLARIEERVNAQITILDRIEKQLASSRKQSVIASWMERWERRPCGRRRCGGVVSTKRVLP